MDDRTVLVSAAPLGPEYQITCYTIREVLGRGGFGITYLAHDNNLDRDVAIKEYLPTSFAHRQGNQSVRPITSDQEDNFAWGLANFLKEAKTLARFNHENIVRVHTVFEANETAYMVMEYEQGEDLASIINDQGAVTQEFQKKVFYPIIEGLSKIHGLGFIHRDIKPSNIYLRSNGSPVLIDFGSARQTALQQTSEFTALISQGYTPLEQYSADYGNQGPWTDIYSMAATMYHGITGSKPVDSLGRSASIIRSQPDRVKPLSSTDYPGYEQRFLDAIYDALSLQPELRPQSLIQWLDLFITHKPEQLNDNPTPGSVPLKQDHNAKASITTDPSLYDQSVRYQRGSTSDHARHNTDNTIASQHTQVVHDEQFKNEKTHKGVFSDDDFNIPPSNNRPTQTAPPKSKKGLVVMCTCLMLAAAGFGAYYFLQQRADPYHEPLVQPTTDVGPDDKQMTDILAPSEPLKTTEVASDSPEEKSTEIFFDQPLATDIVSPARSIRQLAKSSPIAPPIDGLDDAAWKEKDCSSCHDWTKESLCTQGGFYVSNGDKSISRINHPFGGFFKDSLKNWAEQGCR